MRLSALVLLLIADDLFAVDVLVLLADADDLDVDAVVEDELDVDVEDVFALLDEVDDVMVLPFVNDMLVDEEKMCLNCLMQSRSRGSTAAREMTCWYVMCLCCLRTGRGDFVAASVTGPGSRHWFMCFVDELVEHSGQEIAVGRSECQPQRRR